MVIASQNNGSSMYDNIKHLFAKFMNLLRNILVCDPDAEILFFFLHFSYAVSILNVDYHGSAISFRFHCRYYTQLLL